MKRPRIISPFWIYKDDLLRYLKLRNKELPKSKRAPEGIVTFFTLFYNTLTVVFFIGLFSLLPVSVILSWSGFDKLGEVVLLFGVPTLILILALSLLIFGYIGSKYNISPISSPTLSAYVTDSKQAVGYIHVKIGEVKKLGRYYFWAGISFLLVSLFLLFFMLYVISM